MDQSPAEMCGVGQLDIDHHQQGEKDEIRDEPIQPSVQFPEHQRQGENHSIQGRQADEQGRHLLRRILMLFDHFPAIVVDLFEHIERCIARRDGHVAADRAHHQKHQGGQSEPTAVLAQYPSQQDEHGGDKQQCDREMDHQRMKTFPRRLRRQFERKHGGTPRMRKYDFTMRNRHLHATGGQSASSDPVPLILPDSPLV
jgi:hypothetical protein